MGKKVFLLFLIIFLFLSQIIFNKRVFACVPGETSACVKTHVCCCSALPCGSTCSPCDQVGCHDLMEYYVCQDDGTWPGWGECCGAGCFTGETRIQLKTKDLPAARLPALQRGEPVGQGEAGSKLETREIKDLKVGDEVGCFREDEEEGICRVTEVFSRESNHYYLLETATGRKVKTTQEHPFWAVSLQEVIERGEPSFEKASFISVKNLSVGDWVFVKGVDDLVAEQITKLERHNEPIEVYNLSVDGEETFFANDFAVHNKAGVDDVKPECRVIVNPTVTDVSSLIKNRSFESPLWVKHEMNCPSDWYNRDDGGSHGDEDWCDYGLSVTKDGYHPDLNQHVIASYPNYGGFQRISGLETFQPNKVLYRGSAWGKGGATYIGLRDGGRYGNIGPANNGDSWARGSLLGWDFDRFYLICRNCEEGWNAEFDLVSLEKLVGSTQTTSQNVNLFVAFDDNRNVVRLGHWNSGEPEPDFAWDSGDPRVIDFGTADPKANGIPHTITGSGSQTINVKVMDGSGNISDTCSATVNYIPPTGRITGKVYQADETGACNTTNAVSDWTVTCDGIPAKKEVDGVTFTCCKDESCTDFQLPYDNYDIVLTAPGWKMADVCTEAWSGGGPYTVSIPLNKANWVIDPMYLWQGFQKWFQTQGGDVHAEGGITSLIPPSPSPDPYFSLRVGGAEKTAGVVTSGGSRDFAAGVDSTGIVSLDGWQGTEDSSLFVEKGKYNYDYYKDLLSGETSAIEEEFTDLGEETGNYTRGGGAGLIVEDGDSESVGTLTVSGGKKLIYLVDGDLQVKDNVEVEEGSFLAIIVSGDMTIDSGVTTLEGVYIADGTISTGTVGGDTVDAQLVLNGTFVGYGGFNLERDLKEDNTTFPAHVFTYRPEFIINAPESLFTQPFTWKQVAPEGNP